MHFARLYIHVYSQVRTCYIFGHFAKNVFLPLRDKTTTCSNSHICMLINIKIGSKVHWGGVCIHVYSQISTCCVFGKMAKHFFFTFFYYISQTNQLIDMKFGMQVHFDCTSLHIYFQVPN